MIMIIALLNLGNTKLVKMRKERKNRTKSLTNIQIDPNKKLNSVDQLLDFQEIIC